MVIDRVKRKLHRYGWLLRYWVMDKYFEPLRICALSASVVVTILYAWDIWASRNEAADSALAIWWNLVILVVAAVVSYALAPKPESAKPVEGKAPVVQDGKAIVRVYGTVWIDDSGIAAPFGDIPPDPIRKKGGKK